MRSALLVTVVITILFAQLAAGQNKRPTADPQDKDRNVKPEPDRALTGGCAM